MSKNGVLWYQAATARIFFPEDRVCCDLCPLMETYARKQCRRTGEYLSQDTRVTVGYECPLEFETKEVNDEREPEYEAI